MVLLIHINAEIDAKIDENLHSNMVLLIRGLAIDEKSGTKFTFQYGSINTNCHIYINDCSISFTFQYGSINTG